MINLKKTLARAEREDRRPRARIVGDMAILETTNWAGVPVVQTEAASLSSGMKPIARDQAHDAPAADISTVDILEKAGAMVRCIGQTVAQEVGRAYAALVFGATRVARSSLGLRQEGRLVTSSGRERLSSLVVGAALFLGGTALATAADSTTMVPMRQDLASRTFAAGCNSCHYRGGERAAFGRRSPLGESSPDEAAQYILFGKAPESDEGGMPAFGQGLSDADIARLLVWMRETAMPGKPWNDVTASVARMRSTGARED